MIRNPHRWGLPSIGFAYEHDPRRTCAFLWWVAVACLCRFFWRCWKVFVITNCIRLGISFLCRDFEGCSRDRLPVAAKLWLSKCCLEKLRSRGLCDPWSIAYQNWLQLWEWQELCWFGCNMLHSWWVSCHWFQPRKQISGGCWEMFVQVPDLHFWWTWKKHRSLTEHRVLYLLWRPERYLLCGCHRCRTELPISLEFCAEEWTYTWQRWWNELWLTLYSHGLGHLPL